ncbi:hypothetical protein BH24ACT26_BH24ACT26_10910 [soil metagenome]
MMARRLVAAVALGSVAAAPLSPPTTGEPVRRRPVRLAAVQSAPGFSSPNDASRLGRAEPPPVSGPRGRPVTDVARPKVVRVAETKAPRPSGRLRTVPGSTRAYGSGRLLTFDVQIEGGLGIDARAFGRRVERILFARRGWTHGGGVSFQRVPSKAVGFHVILAGPELTDRLCAPALTAGLYSCHNDGRVVVNFRRWTEGADSYGDDLARYRVYVINHEVGHALGKGHLACAHEGAPAPIMMQQTKGVEGCRANPWPLPYERV